MLCHSSILKWLINGKDIFQRAVDLVPTQGFRIIAVNRRDYRGSTPLSADDMARVQSDDCTSQDLKDFLFERSKELAAFIKGIIEKHHIPEHNSTTGSGGV